MIQALNKDDGLWKDYAQEHRKSGDWRNYWSDSKCDNLFDVWAKNGNGNVNTVNFIFLSQSLQR